MLLGTEKLGLGCWGLGGDSYGYVQYHTAFDVLSKASEIGVNFFDLSNLYGAGRAEVIFGEWLTSLDQREVNRPVFTTKGGLLPHSGFSMPTDFSEESLTFELQRSLTRLNSESVPIYLLHSPSANDLRLIKYKNISDKFKDLGLIQKFGISLRSPSDIHALNLNSIDFLELNFNLMDMRLDDDHLRDLLSLHNVKIIARTPLAFGFLTNNGVDDFLINNPMSHLKNWSNEQIDIWRNGANGFKKIADEWGMTLEALALSFCITSDMISYVIPGAISVEQVQDNFSGLKVLSREQMLTLKSEYDRGTFYVQKK